MSHLFLSGRRIEIYVYAEVISVLSAMYCKEMKKIVREETRNKVKWRHIKMFLLTLHDSTIFPFCLCVCVTLVSKKCGTRK